MMNEKIFVVETVEITDCDTDESRIAKVITDTKETYSYEDLEEIVDKLNKQQNIIEEQNKEIEESKITIQLYETDVSMRDNFLKSKGLYDEFLQCNMDGE